MDGILAELLQLERVKHGALIDLNSGVYEESVRKQLNLIDAPALSAPSGSDSAGLLAFSKLSRLNTVLYDNLMATAPWIAAASRSYTGLGQIADPAAMPGFSAEA